MIIGNGLLARTFHQYAESDRVIIFASGVSNSRQTQVGEFAREKKLLSSFQEEKAQLIYFSTVSVYDSSMQESAYIRHKLDIEQFIIQKFSSFLIFRLPILVGRSENEHTLTNFFHRQIRNHQTIPVHKNACRYLMDVDDASTLLGRMIDSNQFSNQILDINFNNAMHIDELIGIFENILETPADKQLTDEGSAYSTNNAKFIAFIKSIGFELPHDYVKNTLAKYYGGKR